MACVNSSHRRCAYGEQGWTNPDDRLYSSLNRVVRRMDRNSEMNSIIVRNDILSFRLRCNHPDRRNDVGGAFMPESYYFSYYNFAPIESTYIIDNGECASVNGRYKNPVSDLQRKNKVLDVLNNLTDFSPLKVIAFFSHGWSKGLQFGFDADTTVNSQGAEVDDLTDLAKAISRIAKSDVRIVLYACQTGASPLEAAKESLDREQNSDNPNQTRINRYENNIESLSYLQELPAGSEGFAFKLRDRLVRYCPNCTVDAHITLGHSTKNPFVRRFEAPAGSAGKTILQNDDRLWGKWVRTLRDPFEHSSSLLWTFSEMTINEIHEYLESI